MKDIFFVVTSLPEGSESYVVWWMLVFSIRNNIQAICNEHMQP